MPPPVSAPIRTSGAMGCVAAGGADSARAASRREQGQGGAADAGRRSHRAGSVGRPGPAGHRASDERRSILAHVIKRWPPWMPLPTQTRSAPAWMPWSGRPSSAAAPSASPSSTRRASSPRASGSTSCSTPARFVELGQVRHPPLRRLRDGRQEDPRRRRGHRLRARSTGARSSSSPRTSPSSAARCPAPTPRRSAR